VKWKFGAQDLALGPSSIEGALISFFGDDNLIYFTVKCIFTLKK
jgi:hypothetical protein